MTDTGPEIDITGMIKAEAETIRAEQKAKRATSTLRIANPATDRDWSAGLIRTATGGVRPILANVIHALRHAPEWRGVLHFNEFAVTVETAKVTPWGGHAGEKWTDNHDRLTTAWVQQNGIFAGLDVVGQAVQAVARDATYHPVRDFLVGLRHDGKARLDTWAEVYLGASPDKLIASTFARLWLISAVARVMRPGCKADCILVLEGPQGRFKSSAARTLAEPFFTDQVCDLASKDAQMQVHGAWIIELPELDALGKTETSRIKAFASATFDRFRLPYGRTLVELPRDCVFIGTVNESEYLKDPTGARRFWPIRVGTIDIAALKQDRDQLFAEAMVRYRAGDPWWLQDQADIVDAESEQAERYQGGAWDSIISDWVDAPSARMDSTGHPVEPLASDTESVTIPDILTHAIGKDRGHWTRADQMAVSAALRALGWGRFQQRIGDKREWRYKRETKGQQK